MGDGLSQTAWERLDEERKRLSYLRATVDDIESDLREQAIGSQDGYLLAVANKLRAALAQVSK